MRTLKNVCGAVVLMAVFSACGGTTIEDCTEAELSYRLLVDGTVLCVSGDDAAADDDAADDDAGTDDTAPENACEVNSDCPSLQVCRMVATRGKQCLDECRAEGWVDCCADPRVDCGQRCVYLAAPGAAADDPLHGVCRAATAETCNGVDDDGDRLTDEDFDVLTDVEHCGGCNNPCVELLPHVLPDGVSCVAGVCVIDADGCADSYQNLNGTDADGCEYGCLPTAGGVEQPDGIDNNCDGARDEGFDCALGATQDCGSGTGVCEEGQQHCEGGLWTACLAGTASVPEVCDGFDNDCDHVADNGFDLTTDNANCGACGNDCATALTGADAACTAGVCVLTACREGFMDLDGDARSGCELACDVWPIAAEVCDARERDEDCDGEANEDCACADGAARLCGPDTPTCDRATGECLGDCRLGVATCADGAWGACLGARLPADAEDCDGRDNDCDGIVLDDEADADGDGIAACADDCDDADWFVHPLPDAVAATGYSIELCNGVDDDCNGDTDEDFSAGALCTGFGACEGAVGAWECTSLTTVWCSVNLDGSDFAGSAEVANGLDDNCDGATDEGFTCPAGEIQYCGLADLSRHGRGICTRGTQVCLPTGVWGACMDAKDALPAEACNGLDDTCDDVTPANEADADGDGARVCAGDCADTNADVHPGATELCNGRDDDCDGEADEHCGVGLACNERAANACGAGRLELDGAGGVRCTTMPGGSAHVARAEACNDVDDDCNGVVDDASAATVASDASNCGACGNECRFASGSGACVAGICTLAACNVGFVNADADPATGCEYRCTATGAEVCDAAFADENCDGSRNESCTCPDGTYRPCGSEAPVCDLDDGDCRGECTLGTQRCDAGTWSACNGATFPASVETCDGLDNDCSGGIPTTERDSDGDGFMPCAGDCDDDDPAISPAAVEVCDGVDNDCRNGTDDGFGLGQACNVGVPNGCGVGVNQCDGAGGVRCSTMPGGSAYPNLTEACDNLRDDDCDGTVDEGCGECRPGTREPCGLTDPATHGVGECHFGSRECQPGRTWGACVRAQDVVAETCNSRDDDCDGDTDEDFDLGMPATCGGCFGNCKDRPHVTTALGCAAGECTGVICDEGFVNLDGNSFNGCEYPCHPTSDGVEACDRIDNDCDGTVDEGFNLNTDLANCGSCGDTCSREHATAACVAGACTIASCKPGYVDADFNPDTGCEYACTPTGPETCDDAFKDEDCDGSVNEGCGCINDVTGACGPLAPACDLATGECVGECSFGTQQCLGGVLHACHGAQFPQVEWCNFLDDDCNGIADKDRFDLQTDTQHCGRCNNNCFGLPDVSSASCEDGTCIITTCHAGFHNLDGNVENGCEYSCHKTNGSVEQCDSIDNDCDDDTDEGFALDTDVAHCGGCNVACSVPGSTMSCVDGMCEVTGCDAGFNLVGGACLRCEVRPPRAESCDSAFVDDDCDGLRNEDCDCTDGATQPCGTDPALNGVGQCLVGIQTCADGVWGTCVGAVAPSSEVCDGLDNDCAGGFPATEVDNDGDGFRDCAGDCDDTNAAFSPLAVESCNTRDDDCDGVTDDGFSVGRTCNVGVPNGCGVGLIECDGAGGQRCSTMPGGSAYPNQPEACDDLVDNDCNGIVDEDCGACTPGDETVCGDTSTHGVGECHVGFATCGADRTFGACVGSQDAMPETCDGADNDCDGSVDEDFDLLTDEANCGVCGFGLDDLFLGGLVVGADCVGGAFTNLVCFPGYHNLDGDRTCEYGCFETKGGIEVDNCDGVDNDCNGLVDDDPTCSPPPIDFDDFTFTITIPDTPACPLDGSARLDGSILDRTYRQGVAVVAFGGVDGRTITAAVTAMTGFHQLDLCIADCDTPSIAKYAVFRDGTTGDIVACGTPVVTFASGAVGTTAVPNTVGGGTWATDEFAVP